MSYAGACFTTVTAALSSALTCSDDDILNITSAGSISYDDHKAVDLEDESGVQITNNGTIETANGTDKQKPIHAESSLNTTITNNGTINSDNNEGIYLDYAENVVITNNSGATINAEGNGAIEGRNIGYCDKAGNNNNCQSSLSSSGSTGVGLKLYNHGTISSTKDTIWMGSGSAGAPRSRGVKIYNYDGGTITSSGQSAIIGKYLTDSEIINYEGATIQAEGRYGIMTEKSSDLTITNHGTIESTNNSIYCRECSDITFTNTGTITAAQNTVLIGAHNNSGGDSITITNSGTITATTSNAALTSSGTDGAVITNTGSINGVGRGIHVNEVDNSTITNHGTITATGTTGYGIWYENDGTNRVNNTLNNFGTISAAEGTAADGIGIGKSARAMFNITINNSGTITGSDNSILILNSSSTGIDIVTKGEGTYEGEIDLNSTATTMTLDCSISKDQKIEIHNKTSMVITSNLCGNDTYEILDSNSDADADNSETNGFLYVYGEDLDIDSHNKKFRTEIFLAKLNNIFNSTDENEEQRTYYSAQKRDNIYKNYENGVLGFFEKKDKFSFLEKPFISYSDQRASFNNSEYTGSKNLAIGFRKQIAIEDFSASIVPVLGLSQNKVVDVETETNQWIKKGFSSQFAGVNTSISKKIDYDNESNLTLEVNGTYGIHNLPKYITNFTDGDLSVDDAIDQVLGAGFNVKYSKKNTNGFVLEPYAGLSVNNTLSNDVGIIADGESKEAGHVMNGVLARNVGLNLIKNNENFSFAINFNYQDQDGLKENAASISLSKKIQQISKLRKEREREIPELEQLFDKLQLAKENERLAVLAGKTAEENKVMKELIIQLLKENQKLKTENKIFKK